VLALVIYKVGSNLLNKVMSMQMEMFSGMQKANFTVIDPHLKTGVPKVSFKDVAGLHEAKIEVKEFVDYLSKPEKYIALGARVPKGALLLGPPGCGKTLLAKAVAAEANVPFFNMNGTEFIEIVGGVGASRVRSLFEEAKKQSPSIIYIDELDAVGKKRSASEQSGGSGEADQTLNQLLVSMDGLESNSNVIVLASTNRADTLDKALLRPGRLDRHITIDLPTFLERKEILAVHMRHLVADFDKSDDKFISEICHLTPRFSGADLANICNEAALRAARQGHKSIAKSDFNLAIERVLAGPEKKTSTKSVEDQKMIAYRECGHIIVSWFHQHSDLILKVSLLSRTKSSSFSQYLPSDRKLFSKEELFDQMCLYFGGRVVESLVFNRFTTESESDLKKITNLAYAQIESYGMSDVVGNVSFATQREQKMTAGQIGMKPYSKRLRNTIDQEVNKLIYQAHEAALQTVKCNMDKLHRLSEELIKRESLNYEEIIQLIGPPLNKSRFTLAESHAKTTSDI
jgi:spastic paraplegia protein 7